MPLLYKRYRPRCFIPFSWELFQALRFTDTVDAVVERGGAKNTTREQRQAGHAGDRLRVAHYRHRSDSVRRYSINRKGT